MKHKIYVVLFFLTFSGISFSQTYSGPAEGSVASGSVTNTDNFLRVSPIMELPGERGIRNVVKPLDIENTLRFTNTQEGDNYIQDPSVVNSPAVYDTVMSVLLKSFNGIAETNSIPPDPYCAVGPTHIMATVNSRFAIWDKEGNLVKNIDATAWYRTLFSAASPFDPKVQYDHFAKRWIMVWLHQDDATQKSFYLLSVSDDSIPTGKWYNWALPSNQNGNTVVTNWGDYQGVGFDKNSIYISSNQFQFGGSFQYVKFRIIPKAQLLVNGTTAGPVIWNDFWNIYYPSGGPSQRIFNLRPSVSYTDEDTTAYYMLHASNFSSGQDFMALYKITNPTTTPTLSGTIVPVNYYYPAPNASQLGGGSMLLETGGSNLRNEPTYRDGYLWAVHNIRNPQSSANSSVRYVKINVATSTAVEDVAMGAPNYWYSYSALAVDKDYNIGITFSRSATNEYCGAYYTYRAATDAPGLRGSITLQSGRGNYVKDYSSGRNRWGDYNGIWLDPSDNYSMWMFTEYVASTNTWGTWTGKIRLAPFSGIYPLLSASTLDFNNTEINTNSDTLTLTISNCGDADLVIQNIPASVGQFSLLNQLTYPYNITTYDSLKLTFVFSPVDTGAFESTFPITTNDPSVTGITVKGYAYKIVAGTDNILYAISGPQNNSMSLVINKQTGAGTLLGSSKQIEVRSIAMHPKTKVIYGVNANNEIVRYNVERGDVYKLFKTDTLDIYSVAFDTSGQLYCAKRQGDIFRVNLQEESLTFVAKANIGISDMVFNPKSNELWASIFLAIGTKRDRIYKIDLASGDTLLVGQTGTTNVVPAITFDDQGNLYGIAGNTSQINYLVQIDTTTGAADTIGSIGYKNITGLAHSITEFVSVNDNHTQQIPSEFTVKQNYPNPFNPSTLIEFSIPEAANVKVTIYNLLGESVDVLLNASQKSGLHSLVWNTSSKSVSSGIYFYEVKAKTVTGREYSSIKKMILMK